jgi:hypothetical protein
MHMHATQSNFFSHLELLLPPSLSSGFAPGGAIKINNGANIAYTYVVLTDNLNSRTLQSLSTTSAAQQTNGTGKYYSYYQKYVDYYGDTSYSDRIALAAFESRSITLKNSLFDFTGYPISARDRTCIVLLVLLLLLVPLTLVLFSRMCTHGVFP